MSSARVAARLPRLNVFVLVTFVGALFGVRATFDLNREQLRFVASHLGRTDCRKLSESLHKSREFQVGGVSSASSGVAKLTGDAEPNATCLQLLLRWNEREGYGRSFRDLTRRLRQLGFPEVAGKLARAVTAQKATALRNSVESFRKYEAKFTDEPLRTRVPEVDEQASAAPPWRRKPQSSVRPHVQVFLFVVFVSLSFFLVLLVVVLLQRILLRRRPAAGQSASGAAAVAGPPRPLESAFDAMRRFYYRSVEGLDDAPHKDVYICGCC